MFNFFYAGGSFCRLLTGFAFRFDQDQDRLKLPQCSELFENVYFEKQISRRPEKNENLPSMQRLYTHAITLLKYLLSI